VQKASGLKELKLIQDMRIRWAYTSDMTDSLMYSKRPIQLILHESNDAAQSKKRKTVHAGTCSIDVYVRLVFQNDHFIDFVRNLNAFLIDPFLSLF
jgi:hypothetical protein